jgi:NAD(P)-dependent dehydrogenase (short-subunit alcohol dehydrogenase family)
MKLNEKIALITGSTGALGPALVLALARIALKPKHRHG